MVITGSDTQFAHRSNSRIAAANRVQGLYVKHIRPLYPSNMCKRALGAVLDCALGISPVTSYSGVKTWCTGCCGNGAGMCTQETLRQYGRTICRSVRFAALPDTEIFSTACRWLCYRNFPPARNQIMLGRQAASRHRHSRRQYSSLYGCSRSVLYS